MSNSRILIVDDNIDFGFSLGEILKDEGYEVECASTGEDALEIFRRDSFDLVLLDMKLPRISGIEVLFELRRINPDIRVLMMSGHSVTDLLSQAVDGGMHRIFYSPYRLESLHSVIKGMDGVGLALVADDAPDLADIVRQTMIEENYSVIVATEGPAAVEQVTANGCDLLLLDLKAPVIRGLEVYWELKRLGQAVPTVIIIPSPDGGFITIEKLNHFPACGYFIKPFNPLDLLPSIAAMVD